MFRKDSEQSSQQIGALSFHIRQGRLSVPAKNRTNEYRSITQGRRHWKWLKTVLNKQTSKHFVSTALTDEGLAKSIHLEVRDGRTSRTARSLQDEKASCAAHNTAPSGYRSDGVPDLTQRRRASNCTKY